MQVLLLCYIRNSLVFVRCFLCLIFLLLFFFACTLNAVRIGFIKLYLTAKHTGRKIIKNERIPAVGLPLHGNVNSIVRAFLEQFYYILYKICSMVGYLLEVLRGQRIQVIQLVFIKELQHKKPVMGLCRDRRLRLWPSKIRKY